MYSGQQTECSNIIAGLKDYSHDVLQEILESDEKIEVLLSVSDQEGTYLKNLESEKEMILAENQSLSEANLAREPELVEGREQLHALTKNIQETTKRLEEKFDEIKKMNGDLNAETALVLLQTAASEMESTSDDVAKELLQGGIELEDFLEKYISLRKLMHLRNAKADKLSRIISGGAYSNVNYGNLPPMTTNQNYFPPNPLAPPVPNNSVPYPVGPMNMPLPGNNYFSRNY